jgi:hypothetical protein
MSLKPEQVHYNSIDIGIDNQLSNGHSREDYKELLNHVGLHIGMNNEPFIEPEERKGNLRSEDEPAARGKWMKPCCR